MITAVIFDIDGTLVDSVDLHAKAWREAFAHFGHPVDYMEVRRQIGKDSDKLIPHFLSPEEYERAGKQLDDYRSQLYKREYLPKVQAFPRVRELFECIRADGKRIALASSAKGDELATYKRIADIEDLVDEQTSSDDAEHSKPCPDIIEAALECLGNPAPEQATMLVDTPYDAQAAAKIGVQTIGFLCGAWGDSELRAAGCVEIYRDPADLVGKYDESLLASERKKEAA